MSQCWSYLYILSCWIREADITELNTTIQLCQSLAIVRTGRDLKMRIGDKNVFKIYIILQKPAFCMTKCMYRLTGMVKENNKVQQYQSKAGVFGSSACLCYIGSHQFTAYCSCEHYCLYLVYVLQKIYLHMDQRSLVLIQCAESVLTHTKIQACSIIQVS